MVILWLSYFTTSIYNDGATTCIIILYVTFQMTDVSDKCEPESDGITRNTVTGRCVSYHCRTQVLLMQHSLVAEGCGIARIELTDGKCNCLFTPSNYESHDALLGS